MKCPALVPQEVDIPADMVDKANEYREKMIDAIVEQDDAVSGPRG